MTPGLCSPTASLRGVLHLQGREFESLGVVSTAPGPEPRAVRIRIHRSRRLVSRGARRKAARHTKMLPLATQRGEGRPHRRKWFRPPSSAPASQRASVAPSAGLEPQRRLAPFGWVPEVPAPEAEAEAEAEAGGGLVLVRAGSPRQRGHRPGAGAVEQPYVGVFEFTLAAWMFVVIQDRLSARIASTHLGKPAAAARPSRNRCESTVLPSSPRRSSPSSVSLSTFGRVRRRREASQVSSQVSTQAMAR